MANTPLTPVRPEPEKPRGPTPWRAILGVLALVYAAIILLLNTGEVEISFLFFSANISLIFLILLSMGLGALIALFGPAYWRRRERLKRLQQ
ncbi:MAG: LapA family protein [Gaiella sp.]